jgi:hypothetical protein
MASKRSHRGRRVGPPRFFYFPWEEKDRRVRRERELAREAERWDEDRIRRFWEDQQRKREWINFAEIAEWFSELGGSGLNETEREKAYRMLEDDLLAGVFEGAGHSQVLFTHPQVSLADEKMTRQWLKDAIDHNLDNEDGRSYLKHCWLPRNLFERWCARHHLPKSPPRFQPSQESRGRVLPEGADGSPEPPMPAPMLVPQPASKLAVNIVDQTEVPNPFKASNKGGRPPAVDWEALKDALREEIKIHGYPDPRNPPGWRGTKDAVEFAVRRLGKEGGDVSHRTLEDNVRRILRELKASTAKPVSR